MSPKIAKDELFSPILMDKKAHACENYEKGSTLMSNPRHSFNFKN
jgi:hypothetical protein